MKKIIITLLFIFIFASCSQNQDNNNQENIPDFSLKNINESNKNNQNQDIKNICDNIKKGQKLDEIEQKFGKATLLSETIDYSTYYYGDVSTQSCHIYFENGEVFEKNFLNI